MKLTTKLRIIAAIAVGLLAIPMPTPARAAPDIPSDCTEMVESTFNGLDMGQCGVYSSPVGHEFVVTFESAYLAAKTSLVTIRVTNGTVYRNFTAPMFYGADYPIDVSKVVLGTTLSISYTRGHKIGVTVI